MNRRLLARALGLSPTVLACAAWGQAGTKLPLVAYLSVGPPPNAELLRRYHDEFDRLGWRSEVNIRFVERHSGAEAQLVEAAVRDLLALNPALVMASTTQGALAVHRLTRSIPIVMIFGTNPVEMGLAKSLSQPTGNVTGVLTMGAELTSKLFEMARKMAPRASRIAYVVNPFNPNYERVLADANEYAQKTKFSVVPLLIRVSSDVEPAVRSLQPANDFALIVQIDPLVNQYLDRLAALALAAKLPSLSLNLNWARKGGLISYGADGDSARLGAIRMADKILRGTPVGDIPFEQPLRIPLIVNRQTARAIGMALPPEIMLAADEVID